VIALIIVIINLLRGRRGLWPGRKTENTGQRLAVSRLATANPSIGGHGDFVRWRRGRRSNSDCELRTGR